MRKFTFILLCLLFFYSIYAKEVTLETARLIATNLYYERINDFSKLEYQEIKFTKDSGIIADNFYIFNLQDNKGFVLVSSDDAA
ncbi:MAG: hypothetical protein DRJ01_17820, partial [Bacteroidetes bacterium]